MAKINVRSPYHINVTDTNLTSATLDLWIYTGTQSTDRPAVVTYEIESTAYNNVLTFEIAELCKDYLDTTFNGSYACVNIWVDYQVTKFINEAEQSPETMVQLRGFEGYGDFEDAVNPQLADDLLQTNTIMYIPDAQAAVVAVDQEDTQTVKWYKGGVLQSTDTVTSTSESTDEIRYYTDTDIDRVDIYNGVATVQVTIYNVDVCKYTNYKITFVNKYGALQDLWFFKRSDKNLKTQSETYKGNILSSGSYSISEHQQKTLYKRGNKSLTLNSGFVLEGMNDVFEQLFLSEKAWILYGGNTLPITVKSQGFKYKTRVNDRLINYTIDVDFAFDAINNVR